MVKGTRLTLQAEVGKLLKEARLKIFKTQEGIAKETGINQSHISAIERGESNIQLHTLVEFAKAVGLEPVIRFVPSDTKSLQIED